MFVIGIRGRRKFKFHTLIGLAAQICDKSDFSKLDHLEVRTHKIL